MDEELLNDDVETGTENLEDGLGEPTEQEESLEVDEELDTTLDEEEPSQEEDKPLDDGIEKSKSFADRLSKKTKAIEDSYTPYKKALEREAAKYGLSADEYLAELDKVHEEEERERQIEADKAKYGDLPPEVLEKVKFADEVKQKEAEALKWNTEAAEFRKLFPEIKDSKEIPDEVFLIREKENCSIATAYKAYQYEQMKANTDKIKLETEQATIKKMRENSITPGALGGQANVDSKSSINDMSKEDFNALVDKVLRGEIKQL